jgi:tetratricopeptide (TPR) repeat protein
MLKEHIENRQIRIFISSTFRDMQDERSYLVTKVFPALRKYCEQRDVSLFELDLRWGISEEEAKQGKVFDICLKEVLKTRPFFIGLLGERYGWVPNEAERKAMKENTTVFEDFEWLADELDEGTSITEIEFQEGVLRPKEPINAFFYFRSGKMETPKEFCEKPGSNEAKMLLELKTSLRAQNEYPVKEYDSIEQLGIFVENDFKALVDSIFPQGEHSALERERREQRVFLTGKTRVYVPNNEWDAKLDEFSEQLSINNEQRSLVIVGESGIGKSALVANWVKNRLARNIESEKIIYHFIGASQSGGDYRKILQRLIDEVRDIYSLPALKEESISSLEEKKENKQSEELQSLLFSLADKENFGRLIIVLDGIDRLQETDNSKLLNWLLPFPDKVKVIYTCLPDDSVMDIFKRRGYSRLDIGALSVEGRKQLTVDYLKSFSKKLTDAQVNRLATDKESENPLALVAVLDDLRVFGIFENMDKHIEEMLAAPDLDSLFDMILARVEEVFGAEGGQKNLARDILSLISVSRNGLSETEILNLTDAAPLYWSQLASGMAGHLTTMNGLVSFANRVMANAAKKRYLSDTASEHNYRSRIADYMETNEQVSFVRKCDELPYQLLEMEEWDKLYWFLFDYRVFLYIYEKDKYEIGKYWKELYDIDNKTYTPEKYLEIVITAEDKTGTSLFYENIFFILYRILGNYPLALICALKRIKICEEISEKNSELTAAAYDDASTAYRALSDFNKAMEVHKQALEIRKSIHENDNKQIATSYNNIAICYDYLGKPKDALEYHKKALEIRINILGKKDIDTAISYHNTGVCYMSAGDYNNAIDYIIKAANIAIDLIGKYNSSICTYYGNIGLCYLQLGDEKKAFEYLEESLHIRKKILGKNHPDIAKSYDFFGIAYYKIENYEKAIEYFIIAKTLWEESLGKNHFFTANTYLDIGNCYSCLNDDKTAIEYYKEALAVNEKLFGKEHPEIAKAKFNLGFSYNRINDIKNALENYHEALAIFEKTLGKEHKNTVLAYDQLAGVYKKAEEHQKAPEYNMESCETEHALKLECIPEKLCTAEICLAAVQQNGVELKYVPEKLRTAEMCLAAVQNFGAALEYVPETLKTAELCLSAVQDYGKALEYVPEALKTVELCIAAIHKHYLAFKFVPNNLKTPQFCLAAVQHDGWALSLIPEKLKTAEICLAAVRQNGLALEYVPEELRTAEICLAAVQQNGEALMYVHENDADKYGPSKVRKTAELCLAAVKQNSEALQYVPDELKTPELLALAEGK